MSLRDRLSSLSGDAFVLSRRSHSPGAKECASETVQPARSSPSSTPPDRDSTISRKDRAADGQQTAAGDAQWQGMWVAHCGYGSASSYGPELPGWAYCIEDVVDGECLPTPEGTCFCVEHSYPINHPHGRLSLYSLLELPPEAAVFWARDDSLIDLDLSRTVFLDLETTGLAGGTGTYAFIVGIGQIVGDRFRVRQYFLREYGEERAQLLAVNEALADARSLITFNGKCFDWPLLEARFTYSRLRPALLEPLHLDLLYPARRVWRHRLESCSLGSLERNVLGVVRRGDVPGWLIPSLYFQYLTERDARPLKAVFEHNLTDLLSLATLAGLFGQLGTKVSSLPGILEGADYYGIGHALEDAGRLEESALSYERALQSELPSEVRQKALARLSFVYKRLRQGEQAVEIWTRLATNRGGALWPCIELAKHYEHQVRDYARAEEMVLRALAALSLRRGLDWQAGRQRDELEHRLRRIREKQAGGRRVTVRQRRAMTDET